jgi:hypothetical protein
MSHIYDGEPFLFIFGSVSEVLGIAVGVTWQNAHHFSLRLTKPSTYIITPNPKGGAACKAKNQHQPSKASKQCSFVPLTIHTQGTDEANQNTRIQKTKPSA